MNIREWLDHYFWIGVDRIFLIDNGSGDESVALARGHPHSNRIDLIELPERYQQIAHYRNAMHVFNIRKRVDWLMVADLDEFWFFRHARKFKIVLRQYSVVDLVYTNWTMFGSGGFDRHSSSLRCDIVTKRPKIAAHAYSKWLVRTSAMNCDHQFDIHKVWDIDARRVISDNVELQLNHYPIQSREYFAKIKMTRGDAFKAANDQVRDWAYFDRYDAPCVIPDTGLRDLLARDP